MKKPTVKQKVAAFQKSIGMISRGEFETKKPKARVEEPKKKVTITITHGKADCSCSCSHGDALHESYYMVSDDGDQWMDDDWCDGEFMENDARISAEERAEGYRAAGREVEIVRAK